MIVLFDCRHFRGDRPCDPHKKEGVHCGDCPRYEPIRMRILVVKLDAVGDVLRTTSILPGLRATYPEARIDWITREDAVPLFQGNPLVDRVLPFREEAWTYLLSNEYDLAINLDASPASARIGTMARAKKRIGYGFDPRGFVYPWNEEAVEWFEMGLYDDVKLRNRKTYQQIISEICRLQGHERPIRLYLAEAEKEKALAWARSRGFTPGTPVIGLNTGAGRRWEHKKWTEEGFVELIRLLRPSRRNADSPPWILLLGGPEEKDRNRRIAKEAGSKVLDAGTGNDLREFFSLVNLCDLVVTGDTMALHVAVSLGKKVVALFGPTSAAEIELYGRGRKISSDAPCSGCYRTDCDVKPTCMERISATEVFDAIGTLLSCASEEIPPERSHQGSRNDRET
jgi:ADP-heptose:LPS heptosyltransferase